MFDEMAIEPHLQLNSSNNSFDGFEDFGDKSTANIAEHALAFLVKGIKREWKYPVAYAFCKGTTSTIDLVRILKMVIRKLTHCGLKIVATISDQAAINYLIRNSVHNAGDHAFRQFFVIDYIEIQHIYDPPHLLKGIRNNMLTKDLVWESEDGNFRAKWDHIELAYKTDAMSTELRAMPKLTELHINRRRIKKMKVSYAANVLSHTVATVINIFATHGVAAPNGVKMDQSAVGTAKIIKFFDDLFDSVNGSSLTVSKGKPLRSCVHEGSPHIAFWVEAKQNLSKMFFQTENSTSKFVPPSTKNWIVTLNSLAVVYNNLKHSGFKFVKPRVFNQDPLEFFIFLAKYGSKVCETQI